MLRADLIGGLYLRSRVHCLILHKGRRVPGGPPQHCYSSQVVIPLLPISLCAHPLWYLIARCTEGTQLCCKQLAVPRTLQSARQNEFDSSGNVGKLAAAEGQPNLKLGVVRGRENGHEAASRGHMVDAEPLFHSRQILTAPACIRSLMRPQDQPQPIRPQKLLTATMEIAQYRDAYHVECKTPPLQPPVYKNRCSGIRISWFC